MPLDRLGCHLILTGSGLTVGRKKIKLIGLALDHKVTGDRSYTHVTIVSQKAPSLEEGADTFISSPDIPSTSEKHRQSECLLWFPALVGRESTVSSLLGFHTFCGSCGWGDLGSSASGIPCWTTVGGTSSIGQIY